MSLVYKGVLVILDGLGDRSCPELSGATPLEAALTPHLNQLAENGLCGMMDPLFPGVPVGTHTGTALLFGMPSRQAKKLSRGPVEAAGIGVQLRRSDVALRCNFATLEYNGDQLQIIDRRADRIREATEDLAALLRDVAIGDDITADLYPATHHRAVLRLRGPELSAEISDTDPGTSKATSVLQCAPLEPDNIQATTTARALNRFIRIAHERLQESEINQQRQQQGLKPANGIISRGAGKLMRPNSLIHHYGLKAAVVTGEGTVAGLAQLFNYTSIQRPEFTALADTDLQAKVASTKAALQQHDFVVLHLKAPDVCSHDCNPLAKKAFLERFDQAFAPLLDEQCVLAITGDHSTDSNLGNHCGDPVPSLICRPGGRQDRCTEFAESECMYGGLGRLNANAFLANMLDAMGAVSKFHNHKDTGLYSL